MKHRWLRAVDWTFRGARKIGSTGASQPGLCALLDPDGRRCASRAEWLVVVHESAELLNARWFAVPVCTGHKDEADR